AGACMLRCPAVGAADAARTERCECRIGNRHIDEHRVFGRLSLRGVDRTADGAEYCKIGERKDVRVRIGPPQLYRLAKFKMLIAIFVSSLLAAMALGVPIAFSLMVCS